VPKNAAARCPLVSKQGSEVASRKKILEACLLWVYEVVYTETVKVKRR
jgi:hypothetical protein